MNLSTSKWEIFEIKLEGPSTGNPFAEVTLTATFAHESECFTVDGFYDGNGLYKVRFMPESEGEWNYTTNSNIDELNNITGTFTCMAAKEGNHGPVRVHNQFHFAYADKTPYFPFGTTCYAWIHQPEALQEETLKTLASHKFNKLRMCVFPKSYANNANEPEFYPYSGTAPTEWDFKTFNPEFFAHLEKRIKELDALGIETDLIIFHPYDKGHWGFDAMGRENDDYYLKYLVARLSAFKNVWWSMANEYDYVLSKTLSDWEHYIDVVADLDPYHHLLSIHNAERIYDNWNPKITHASIQLPTTKGPVSAGLGRLKLFRDAYHKPVIYDEVCYEGNLVQRWGQSSAEELVDKEWQSIVSGTYCTHGETFKDPEDIIWWAKGGKLKGQSPKRIAFLKEIVEESGVDGLEPLDAWWTINGVGKHGEYYLYYFSYECPYEWHFELPGFKKADIPIGTKFKVEVIDTWNMTVTTLDDEFEITDKGRYYFTCAKTPVVKLPGKPFMAIRITRI